ncbi:MAG: hypothetical protein B7X67_16800 [Rhizobiales bacterium 39-66-18]|nr:MAG: hypothetical protein B7X67_16800 [Rhizobiales bacterium 39-66-18]
MKAPITALILASLAFAAPARANDDVQVISTPLPVEHITVTTPRGYKDVKADIEKLGRLDELRPLIRSNDVEALRAGAKRIAGEDGLAIHYIALHGDLLALKGQKRELVAYYIGNILSATEMTNVDPAAGLYAPLRVVVYANKNGGTTMEYDKPIARSLDDRMQRLLLKVSRAPGTSSN